MDAEYDGRHKKDEDIETASIANTNKLERHHHPKQQSTSADLHVHLHSHHHTHNHHYWCTTTVFLYILFFSLLFVWISLQLTMASIYLNNGSSSLPTAEDASPLSGSTNILQLSLGSVASFVFQMKTGAHSLINIVLRPSAKTAVGSAKVINVSNPAQQIEDDYVFIFYLLLGINFAVMLPRWLKYLSSKVKTKHKTHDGVSKQQDEGDQHLNEEKQSQIHNKLLKVYLPAYFLATAADWLQGPYKYALYASYGYTQRDIAHLFVAGYGSGMILGSIIGGLADSYGRKRLCICYCFAYTFSVTMKHCRHFYVLLLGRVGGGVATSLLFSVFESWLICAHGERGLGSKGGLKREEEEKWLAKSLSVSMYGSSLVAIASGVLANFVVGLSGKMRPLKDNDSGDYPIYYGGYIAAFDACLVPLVLCATLIAFQWEENYGQTAESTKNEDVSFTPNGVELTEGYIKKHSSMCLKDYGSDEEQESNVQHHDEHKTLLSEEEGSTNQQKERMCSALISGIHTVWRSPSILTCCIIGSIFEGAMYIFIFLWTPTLTSLQVKLDYFHGYTDHLDTEMDAHAADGELPFGWIFSTFMVCCMLGTMAFSRMSNAGVPASKCLAGILVVSSLSCLAMACPSTLERIGVASSSANTPQYIGMLIYEFSIGFYYPAMGTVKGTIVPEDQRAAIYNVFRLPLNLLVLVYLVGDFSTEKSFLANAFLLLAACVLQVQSVRGAMLGIKGHVHSS